MTMIDTSNSRFAKALAIADQAGQWLKCRTADGRKAYGVPSQRIAGRYYLVTQTSCTCEDAQRHQSHTCKHALAVQIHCARMAGKPMPASDTLEGLNTMLAERLAQVRPSESPVLDMVRHEDGEISWTRHNCPRPVADASTYDRIFDSENSRGY